MNYMKDTTPTNNDIFMKEGFTQKINTILAFYRPV